MAAEDVCPVWLFDDLARLRVVLAEDAPEVPDRAVDDAWRALCARNPRYFDGPMLAFVSWDADTGVITARRDRFRRLAVRETVAIGVMQLGVTVVTRHRDRVLLGRRSRATRVYGGMWELGPSGGVEVSELEQSRSPGTRVPGFSGGVFVRAGEAELWEEMGVASGAVSWGLLGLVEDPVGGSFEVALEARLGDGVEVSSAPANWEYDEVAWVGVGELGAFVERWGDGVIPPTVALIRRLRWS